MSLCLAPFSKEFNTITGHSKLNIPDDYQELVRVIIRHNRQRLKMGLFVLCPKELEEFLQQEMHQDFSDLGIEIDDFLSDLIKTRQEEDMSFAVYNNYVQKCQKHNLDGNPSITSSPLLPQNITNSPDTKPMTNIPLENSSTPDKKPSANSATPNRPIPPTNLLKKFVSVTENTAPQSSVLDKPIILKNKETRRHVHWYDLRIGIKECCSEEDEQKLLQGLLEEFLDTMHSADRSILVPPY
jgi:hypothetical protein